jgi:hypothetical protein
MLRNPYKAKSLCPPDGVLHPLPTAVQKIENRFAMDKAWITPIAAREEGTAKRRR